MIYNGDQWELQYIKNLKDNHLLAWDDETAWSMYPKYNWVYDKMLLSNITGIPTWDLEKEVPTVFPVVCKPKTNFCGLSKGAYIASSIDEVEDFEGYIAQKYLNGTQFSTDILLNRGEIVDYFTFITHKNNYDELKMFSSTPFTNNRVINKVAFFLKDYIGVCNVEYIDNHIIEIHLRPSLQFFDICGGFIKQIPEFIKNPDNFKKKSKFEQTFSRVFRTRFNGVPEVLKLPTPPSEVRSVQLAWEDGYKLSKTDPSLFRKRYLIINGDDLQKIEDYSKTIKIRIK